MSENQTNDVLPDANINENLDVLSEFELTDEENHIISKEEQGEQFYTKAQHYWSTVPATVNGMLGGFEIIHSIDIVDSEKFLSKIFSGNKALKNDYALDCGAGIGRVTKNLLLPNFNKVDMVEQDVKFTKTAAEYIGCSANKVGKIFNCGLQEFTPEKRKYDVIWCQWVLGHLVDADLQQFLERMRLGLQINGVLVLKENTTSSERVEVDDVDSSVTRPLKSYKKFLNTTGYRIIKLVRQDNLPKGLYPVYMMACVPKSNCNSSYE